jgi:hypothetical protein
MISANPRWSWPHSLRECLLNLTSWGSRGCVELMFAVLAGATLAAWHAAQWHQLDRSLDQQALLGRNTVIFGPMDPSDRTFRVTRASCEALTNDAAVTRSGIVVPLGSEDIAQLGPRVPILAVSRSLLPQLDTHQAVIGLALAGPLSMGDPGTAIILAANEHGTLRSVVGEVQPTGLDSNSAVSVAIDPSLRLGTNCVVQLGTYADPHSVLPRLEAALDVESGRISVRPAATLSFDVVADFLSRPHRFTDLAVAVAAGLMSAALRRLRASELAAYRLSGTASRDLYRITMLEQLTISGAFSLAGSTALICLGQRGQVLASEISWLLNAGLVWLIVLGLLAIPVVCANPMRLAKDR